MNESAHIHGFSQASLSISAVGTQSDLLLAGDYDVWADTECYVKVGPTASDVTTSTGYVIYAGNVVTLSVPVNCRIGAITSAASGTLKYHRVA